MINQNLNKIAEYPNRSEKEDEINLVKDKDIYIKEVLTSKTKIKEEEDINELVQFYEEFGIEYLVVLKIRKETSWFTFFVVLFTGIVK
jgi:Holliday junction resolvase